MSRSTLPPAHTGHRPDQTTPREDPQDTPWAPTLVGLLSPWLLVAPVSVVLLVVLLARTGGDSGRGGQRGRGSGLPILLAIGLLLVATVFGSNVIRTVVTTLVHALTTIGGLFGG